MLYRFDDFEVDADNFALRRAGAARHVEPLVFDLILFFSRNPDRMISREELQNNVWDGRIVSDATISSCIKSARQAFGESGSSQQGYIQTVRGRGFRFLADVVQVGAAANETNPTAEIDIGLLATAATAVSPTERSRPSEKPVLAVLPFVELSREPEDFFSDGVVEEITAALSRNGDFHVIARQSTFAIRDQNLDARAVAERLGAGYLLDGSIHRIGERVRIGVQLVDGSNAKTVSSSRFEDHIDDLFCLQDRIAEKVAGELSPNLRSAEISRARTRAPAERSAYDLVLTAYPHFWAHRREGNSRAIELLDAALAKDPDYALALALKGWALAQHTAYIWSDDPKSDRENAVKAAEQAAMLVDDNTAATQVAIGATLTLATSEQIRAKRFIDRALKIDPNNAWGWMRSGWIEIHLGNYAEALRNFDDAQRLSPLDPFRFNMLFGRAVAHELQGDLDQAIALVEEGLQTGPGVKWAYRLLARFYRKRGQSEEAARTLQKLCDAYPKLTIKFLRESVPPSIANATADHFADLRAAGLPEE